MAQGKQEQAPGREVSQPQFKIGQASHPPEEDQGTAFEYQKDKPITGEQHGPGKATKDEAQASRKEHPYTRRDSES